MVRDAHEPLAEGPVPAPPMLRHPADAPQPLGHVSASDGVRAFRRVWSDRNAATTKSFRAWAGRVSGRSDRRLLVALVGATEATAAHCDQLVDRLNALEAVTADVTDAFGQEIVRLRAEVVHLQRSVDALRGVQP
jgi:hypothetical protein